jgi:hypothetical protein
VEWRFRGSLLIVADGGIFTGDDADHPSIIQYKFPRGAMIGQTRGHIGTCQCEVRASLTMFDLIDDGSIGINAAPLS